MKKQLLLFLFLASGFAYGQITLQHSHYQSGFSVGTVFYTYSTPIGGPAFEVFIGQASSTAQIWDFAALPMEHAAISRSIQPSTAPLINEFPAANIVLYEKYWFGENDTLFTWNYKNLTTDKLLLLGDSDELNVIWTWDPPAAQAKIPMTLGTTWVQTRDSTYIMPETYTISETVVTIDAFGTLKITAGEYPCLRMRLDDNTIIHTPVGTTTTKKRSFNFYTQGMIEVHVSSIQENQFNLQTISVTGVKISSKGSMVGLQQANMQPGGLQASIHPNPVYEKAEIQYCLPRDGKTRISLTDLAGRKVASWLTESQSAGNYKIPVNVSDFPAGIYLVRLETIGQSITKKLVVYR